MKPRTISGQRQASVTAGSAIVFAAFFLLAASPATARQFHVMATGTSEGTGSLQNPWDLQTAFNHPPAVQPGDTIWIHGGTYSPFFLSFLQGTPSAPILVRNYRNERVTLLAPDWSSQPPLSIEGDHVWFWGLEITSLVTNTQSINVSNVYIAGRDPGLSTGTRIINCVIHDGTGNGIGDQSDSEGTEVYGCLIYNNGRTTINDNNAYGIYGQNFGLRKNYVANILLNNFGNYQFHLFTENSEVDSFTLKHNVSMSTVSDANLLFSEAESEEHTIDSNYFYGGLSITRPLYTERKALKNPVMRGNFFMRGRMFFRELTFGRVYTGNVNYGHDPIQTSNVNPNVPFDTSTVPGNVWFIAPDGSTPPRPAGVWIRFVPNRYEPARSHVIVYNWDLLDSVSADLSFVLPAGTRYEVRDAQNYYGPPVLEGQYAGGVISLPMTQTDVSVPVTFPATRGMPVHTGREFGVFVVKLDAPSGNLTADPDTLEKGGGDVMLNWTSQGATRVTINHGVGQVPLSGTRTINVTASRIYVLTMEGPGGTTDDSVFVYVRTDAPDTPVPSEPLSGSTAVPVPATIAWSPVVNGAVYHLQISIDDQFQALVVNDTTVSGATTQVAGLSPYIDHWWRARAKGLTGVWGEFSAVWHFRTRLGPPALLFPADGASNVPIAVTLMWDTARGATRYHMQMVKDSIQMIFDDSTLTGTSFPIQILERGARFEWRVRSRNSEGWSEFSPIWSFRTTVTSVEPTGEIPEEYALSQNYPNPFNPATTIRFGLPRSGEVRLSVYDLVGREVARPVDGTMPAGTYTVLFDATSLATGVYYYRLSSGSFVGSRKMVLIR